MNSSNHPDKPLSWLLILALTLVVEITIKMKQTYMDPTLNSKAPITIPFSVISDLTSSNYLLIGRISTILSQILFTFYYLFVCIPFFKL